LLCVDSCARLDSVAGSKAFGMLQGLAVGERALSYAAPEDGLVKQSVVQLVELLSGRGRVDRIYREARAALRPDDDIWAAAMRGMRLRVRFSAERLAAVPRRGPLVVVANHPFGIVDGLVLCHLVSLVRQDFKVVAMSVLCRGVPEVRGHVLPINFAGTPEAVATSARSRRAARALLAEGRCLIIFPAGEVSTSRGLFGPADDAPWHPFAGRLIQGAQAAVLPVRFEGQNSRLFHLASRVSPTLRLSLLLREAVRRVGSEVVVRVGEVQPFEALRFFEEQR
jgi:putative hemolysin